VGNAVYLLVIVCFILLVGGECGACIGEEENMLNYLCVYIIDATTISV